MNIRELLGIALFVTGIFFMLVTALGMIRFEDVFMKFHFGSKCLTAGAISILSGAILYKGMADGTGKIVIMLVFLAITNPLASHALAKAAYSKGVLPKNLKRDDYGGNYESVD
jgi:multicomponent Na+:H+ antiporter subunit G